MKIVLAAFALAPLAALAADASRPNIVFILADDLGRADVGCFGQKRIKTPNIDKLAAEGVRFTQAYTAASVCAPSRTSFITGLHQGHAPIRHNREIGGGQLPIPEGYASVARTLKSAGYATGCFGKWGMGPIGSSGDPNKIGFDDFFGYICQAKAHNYYPKSLQENGKEVPLDGKTYSADLIAAKMNAWLKKSAGKPFFLFHATTLPHANLQTPSTAPYDDTGWTKPQKTYATMVTTLDRHVGEIVKALKDAGVYENTLIVFTSDNGYASPAGVDDFFHSNGGLRGIKRSMYEGGLREPFVAVWPGRIPAGKTETTPIALYDLHATFAAAAGAKAPATDGLNLLPLLTKGEAPKRDMLYFELYEPNFRRAARIGDMKVVVPAEGAKPELYDLAKDPAEKNNLADERPDFLKSALARMDKEHTDYAEAPEKHAGKKKKKK